MAISSTGRSPWASRSAISARRPLASAFATSAKASNSASLAARSAMSPYSAPRKALVKYSFDLLTSLFPGAHHSSIGLRKRGDDDEVGPLLLLGTSHRLGRQQGPPQPHRRHRPRQLASPPAKPRRPAGPARFPVGRRGHLRRRRQAQQPARDF